MAGEKNPSPQGGDAAKQAADDNRSQQLNSQDSTFYRSRGESETDSADQARETTQQNQQKK